MAKGQGYKQISANMTLSRRYRVLLRRYLKLQPHALLWRPGWHLSSSQCHQTDWQGVVVTGRHGAGRQGWSVG